MITEISEIERLLETCRKLGVEELSHGDFRVKFVPGGAVQVEQRPGEAASAPDLQELQASVKRARAQLIEEQAQDELALMQVDDPEQFEELLIQRELGQSEQAGFDDFDANN